MQPVTCPACKFDGPALQIDVREKVPTLQNATVATPKAAEAFPCGRLEMLQCTTCEFVWNNAFDPEIIIYDSNYNNDVSSSKFYQKHLDHMADRVISSISSDDFLRYLEIGCGQADFMKIIIERAGVRCQSAIGFDPSFIREDTLPATATVHKSYFSSVSVGDDASDANIICSRHTIEHVPDVDCFVSMLASAMTHPDQRLFLETPDVDWIFKNLAAQDFFYEHCSLFNPKSIKALLARHGLEAEVFSVYNEQYMWVSARKIDNVHGCKGASISPLGAQYSSQRDSLISRWRQIAITLRETGPVAIWGAASKGVTFALLTKGDGDHVLSCAIDLNTDKQGRFLPVSGLQVVCPASAKKSNIKSVIVMNPNYEAEIRNLAAELGWTPKIIVLGQALD